MYNGGQIEALELATRKSEFLKTLKKDRETWESLLARVGHEEMIEPGLPGGWCVKDVIAHVTWYERQTIKLLETRSLVGSDWWKLTIDERNELIYEQYKDQPLEKVLESAKLDYAGFLVAFGPITDEELNDPSCFEYFPPDREPWNFLAGNTYEHYRDHIADIEAWLDAKNNS